MMPRQSLSSSLTSIPFLSTSPCTRQDRQPDTHNPPTSLTHQAASQPFAMPAPRAAAVAIAAAAAMPPPPPPTSPPLMCVGATASVQPTFCGRSEVGATGPHKAYSGNWISPCMMRLLSTLKPSSEGSIAPFLPLPFCALPALPAAWKPSSPAPEGEAFGLRLLALTERKEAGRRGHKKQGEKSEGQSSGAWDQGSGLLGVRIRRHQGTKGSNVSIL